MPAVPGTVVVRSVYPGDPEETHILLYGASFKQLQPDRYIKVDTIRSDGRRVPGEKIPVVEVVCDLCSSVVHDHDPCCLSRAGTYLYCWRCFGKFVLPYLTGVGVLAEAGDGN